MPIDLSRFQESYFDEVAEHLATIERIALALDAGANVDQDTYDELFRAAHSMKGASGIFGFTEMAEATHRLEALLDELRDGRLSLSPSIVAALLHAHDELHALLLAYRTNVPVNVEGLKHLAARLEELRTHDASGDHSGEHRLSITFRTQSLEPARSAVFSTLRDALSTIAHIESIDQSEGVWHAVVLTRHTKSQLVDIVRFAQEDEDSISVDDAPTSDAVTPAISADIFGFFDEPAAESTTTPAVEATPVAKTRKSDASEGSTIRVDLRKVDQLIDLVGEMLIAQSSLEASISSLDSLAHQEVFSATERLARYTRDVRESVMAVRMLPIGSLFARFHRVVRDTSRDLGKQVTLRTEGDDTELDKGLLESIVDPLTHLVRNAISHGIEMPEERLGKNKPASGTLLLRAFEQSGNVYIEVSDDGRGIDRDKVIAKARSLDIPLPENPSEQEIFDCIFTPGFSTAEQVTSLSGRGVGMDVVKRNLSGIGGHIDILSNADAGTTMRLRLPLTLAILDGLSVRVGEETLVLPIASVKESIVLSAAEIHHAQTQPFIKYRDGTLPLVFLSEGAEQSKEHVALVVEHDRMMGGLVVDAIEGQHQVVIKSLEQNFRRISGYSGATVLGNGRVAMILDVNEILTSGSFAGSA